MPSVVPDLLLLIQCIFGQIVGLGRLRLGIEGILLALVGLLLELLHLSTCITRNLADLIRLLSVLVEAFLCLIECWLSFGLQHFVGRLHVRGTQTHIHRLKCKIVPAGPRKGAQAQLNLPIMSPWPAEWCPLRCSHCIWPGRAPGRWWTSVAPHRPAAA